MSRDPHSLKSLPTPDAGSAALGIRTSSFSQHVDAKSAVVKIRNDVGQQEKVERKLSREKKLQEARARVKGADSGSRCKQK